MVSPTSKPVNGPGPRFIEKEAGIMMQILNMLWVVVLFWFIIELINSRLNKKGKSVNIRDEFNQEMNK